MDKNTNKSSSQDLLSWGSGGGLSEKLLLKPATGLKTERVPPSSVMGRLQSFLPQIAEANQKLKQQMEGSSAAHFDIENVEEAEKVIEMDVALVELSDSEDEEDASASDEDSHDESDLTEENFKLPGHNRGNKDKINIQVVEQPVD
ncbi:uncharacterized protein C12orf45 homolog [Dunckerocampus dactyliophorus]|uniref:uncharacterized protein C12orf45 homolog n=1 Tax=Dunckerocampus dactyliophorus TaxID=161453 RepID=UPI002406FB28|nr:uncharacterized protein C12orf45 homolog [Dunckerocampus dactyliophorus]